MKKTIYILGISMTILMTGMISCELEEYNPSGVTAESIWGTPEGFQTLVNAAYGNQRTFYGKEDGIIMAEAGTDIWFRSGKSNSYRQVFKYVDLSGSSMSSGKNYWRDLWPAVNYCNAGIERIDDAGFTSERIKNAKEGELRFLRAFYYWHIVETWGGVMLRTSETQAADLTPKRSPVEDFYKLMVEDLEFAVNWLPVVPENRGEYSRATKKSAMGLMARVLLTRAYYSLDKNNATEANDYFTRAKNMAHATIDSAARWGISLYENYTDLWDNTPGGNNKNCTEALYVISNSLNPQLNYDVNGNRLHMWFLASYTELPGMQISLKYGTDDQQRFMPTQHLLDLFDETLDSRYEASFQEVWYCNNEKTIPSWDSVTLARLGLPDSLDGENKFELGDTAVYATKKVVPNKNKKGYLVIDRDSLFRGDTIYSVTTTFPALRKYIDLTRTDSTAQPGYLDIIVIRLAEMYLIAAEAELQLNDKSSTATDLNVIRNRASKTHAGDMNISADQVTLDFILDERARELAGEHLRWFDLKRTRKLVERIDKYNKDIQIPSNLREKGNGMFENVLVRPIPADTELEYLLNREEFGQNPGYID